MQITYNFTGAKRKELVRAISQELNAPVKYLGMPTAAYKVGGYIIDKNGTLMGDDNHELVADLQGLYSFIPISADYDEPVSPTAFVVFEDLQLDGREELGLGRTHREDQQGENGMHESDVPDIDQHHPGQYIEPNEPMSEDSVPVLIWELEPQDETALDRYEGYPFLYHKEWVSVEHRGKPTRVMVYIMNDGRPLGTPGGYYYEVIRDGYITAGFDTSLLGKAAKRSRAAI